MPPHISREIIQKAKTERYLSGQLWEIEAEGKGYTDVEAFSRSYTTMPGAVRDAIVAAAKRENPGDWSRTAGDIQKEAEAWKAILLLFGDHVAELPRTSEVCAVPSTFITNRSEVLKGSPAVRSRLLSNTTLLPSGDNAGKQSK